MLAYIKINNNVFINCNYNYIMNLLYKKTLKISRNNNKLNKIKFSIN